MTYAQDLTFGLRLAFGLGLEFLVALHFCLAWLPGVPVLLSCLACLPCLAALLLPVVVTLPGCLPFLPCLLSCLALPFASLCLALRCLTYAMDVKPTWENMATLAYRVDNVDLNPKINKLGGPGRDVAFACTRPGCRARRPHPLG